MKEIVVTPAFCKSEMLRNSLKNFYEYQRGNYEHWILLNHYPINKGQNNKEIIEIAKQYGCKIFDNEYDRGLHKGCNNFIEKTNFPEGTIWIGWDPDSSIDTIGWDITLKETLECIKEQVFMLALWGVENEQRKQQEVWQGEEIIANGQRVLLHHSIGMANQCAIDLDMIRKIGGFGQPNAYYGGIEVDLYQRLIVPYKKKLAYLMEIKEPYIKYPDSCQDIEYRKWKDAHLAGFTGSLQEWLIVQEGYEVNL